MSKIVTTTTALAFTLLAGAALAQTPGKIRGTVSSIEGTTLRVKANGGGPEVAVTLSPTYAVTAVVPAKLDEIKAGSYIGIAADTQPDGMLVAREVHIFPEAMRGAGEGFRDFDLGPKSTMTNGTVGQEVRGTAGNTLTVDYQGGEKSIAVPPDAPVVSFAPGDKAMLTPGAHVIVQTRTGTAGVLTAERVTVGKDGLVPPM